MRTYSATPSEVEHKWYLIDADGAVLGRLAALVSQRLRGKHKPTFTPHIDCGDHIVVINAAKVALTAKKLEKQEEEIEQLLEAQRKVREVRGEYETKRDTLIDLLEIYDRKMTSHSRRGAKWCRIIGEVIPGLCKTRFQKVSFQMAGLLHDIGKIGLEKELVAMSIESLSKKDLQDRQRHAILGQRILRKLDAFQDIRVVIRHHHEQYDGNGLPEG